MAAKATDVRLMAGKKFDDRFVSKLEPPVKGNRREPDFGKDRVPGLNFQVTAAGLRSWVIRYRFHGVEHLYTFADFPELNTKAARAKARALRQQIRDGVNPKAARDAARAAPTVADMAKRYEAEHLPGKRPRSADEDRALIRGYILPTLGKLKVADVAMQDVRKMHREITAAGKPVRANRALACVRTMFNLAMSPEWKMRADNPARGGTGGIAMNPEDGRERFLSAAEIARLSEVLAKHPEKTTVELIRFLMLTGARFGEAANATWDQIDFAGKIWTRPSAHIKRKKKHAMPLSPPALELLSKRRRATTGKLVFASSKPGRKDRSLEERPITTVKTAWAKICRDAGLSGLVEKRDRTGNVVRHTKGKKKGQPVKVWKSTVRIHDLRHSFASISASGGDSLLLIGSLLGHTRPETTQRYAHLADDARRAAAERVGAVITANGQPPAEVIELPKSGQR
jgi:integrase